MGVVFELGVLGGVVGGSWNQIIYLDDFVGFDESLCQVVRKMEGGRDVFKELFECNLKMILWF